MLLDRFLADAQYLTDLVIRQSLDDPTSANRSRVIRFNESQLSSTG